MNFNPEIATTAIFQSEGQPDMTARVLVDGPHSGISVDIGNGKPPLVVQFPEGAGRLQLAEALQFAADTIGSTVPGRLSPFVRGWINTAADSHQNAKEKGFWEPGTERNDSEMIMLVVTELAEAVEGLRHGNPPDDKVPEFSAAEAEFADAIIRMMDQAHARGWRVAQAIEAKMKFNKGRAHKHGKAF
jgi:NTP pyrophosphatase (non-canonical NTP hydrolase)